MEYWAGKVAIVTGASSGIGTAVAKSLVKHGVKVVGLARRKERIQELANQLGKDKFYPVPCDVTKEDDILRAFSWTEEKFGGADILINNAGMTSSAAIIDAPTQDYRNVINTNLIAPAICSREFAKSNKKRKTRGHICNINSILGHYAEAVHMPLGMYGPSKYGITALTAELRHEMIVAKLNIRVTSISPGAVYTDLIVNALGSDHETAQKAPMLRDQDVADAVIYSLGTPEGSEIYELTIVPQNKPIEVPVL